MHTCVVAPDDFAVLKHLLEATRLQIEICLPDTGSDTGIGLQQWWECWGYCCTAQKSCQCWRNLGVGETPQKRHEVRQAGGHGRDAAIPSAGCAIGRQERSAVAGARHTAVAVVVQRR